MFNWSRTVDWAISDNGQPRKIYNLLVSAGYDFIILQLRHTLQTKQEYYRVDRREIAFIKFIFEAYGGIAALRTIDPQRGIILFYIAPGCERQFEDILQDLSKQIMIQPQKALSGTLSNKHQ